MTSADKVSLYFIISYQITLHALDRDNVTHVCVLIQRISESQAAIFQPPTQKLHNLLSQYPQRRRPDASVYLKKKD